MARRGSQTAATPASSSPITYDAHPRSSWMNWRKITSVRDDVRCARPAHGRRELVALALENGGIGVSTRLEGPFRLSPQATDVDLLAKYFRGFGDPTRLRILNLLLHEERSVGELVAA